MAVETVDPHLGEAAVLAVVLHPHSGLEVQTVGKRAGAYVCEQLPCGDVDQCRTLPALGLCLGGCHHHLVKHERVGSKAEIKLCRATRSHRDPGTPRAVTDI